MMMMMMMMYVYLPKSSVRAECDPESVFKRNLAGWSDHFVRCFSSWLH